MMVGPLLTAVLFAIGHHCFYASANNHPVSDWKMTATILKATHTITSQTVHTAAGTTFAFLFKAALALSLTAAYAQVFWRTAIRKSHKISSIDTLYDGLTNVYAFFDMRVWWKHPLLFLLCTTAW